MKIEVKEGVFWETESKEQSEEAIQWLQEEVRPNLGEPEFDEFKRPYKRAFENEALTVVEEQDYIHQSYEWARKGVIYTIELKEDQNEAI